MVVVVVVLLNTINGCEPLKAIVIAVGIFPDGGIPILGILSGKRILNVGILSGGGTSTDGGMSTGGGTSTDGGVSTGGGEIDV